MSYSFLVQKIEVWAAPIAAISIIFTDYLDFLRHDRLYFPKWPQQNFPLHMHFLQCDVHIFSIKMRGLYSLKKPGPHGGAKYKCFD